MQQTAIYSAASIEHPTAAQQHFLDDAEDPMAAVRDYARSMHRHTKSQMENSTSSSRRSSNAQAVSSMAHLSHQGSASSDASSMDSRRS